MKKKIPLNLTAVSYYRTDSTKLGIEVRTYRYKYSSPKLKTTHPRSTLSIRRHFPNLRHPSLTFIASMSQSSHELACSDCNNWAYACVCRAQGNALYMAPVSYYYQPPSSDYDDYNSSHANFASGSGPSSSPIPLAQDHSNHSQFINLTPSAVNNQPAVAQPSSESTRKRKSSQNTSGASSSKRRRASRKENTSPNTSTGTRSSPSPAVPGAGPSSRPVNSHHVEHPAMYKTSRARREARGSTSQTTNKSAASDAWWFVRPYDTNEKPSESPPPFPDSCRSRTKHKASYVGCVLCPWSVLFSIKVHQLIEC